MPSGAGPLRADGPILTSYMRTFGAKLGLALHFELHQGQSRSRRRPCHFGLVTSKPQSGEIPEQLLATLPAPLTMRQGKKSMSPISFNILGQRLNRGTTHSYLPSFASLLRWLPSPTNDRTRLQGRLAAIDRVGG